MPPYSVVLLQGDARVSRHLASILREWFKQVRQVENMAELRKVVARHRAEVAIADIEIIPLADVELLSRDFPALCIVCTHRLADELMWAAALSAGASDVCFAHDTQGILASVLRSLKRAHSTAA